MGVQCLINRSLLHWGRTVGRVEAWHGHNFLLSSSYWSVPALASCLGHLGCLKRRLRLSGQNSRHTQLHGGKGRPHRRIAPCSCQGLSEWLRREKFSHWLGKSSYGVGWLPHSSGHGKLGCPPQCLNKNQLTAGMVFNSQKWGAHTEPGPSVQPTWLFGLPFPPARQVSSSWHTIIAGSVSAFFSGSVPPSPGTVCSTSPPAARVSCLSGRVRLVGQVGSPGLVGPGMACQG